MVQCPVAEDLSSVSTLGNSQSPYNFGSRESSTLFWPPWVRARTHTHTHTHTHKHIHINKNKTFLKGTVIMHLSSVPSHFDRLVSCSHKVLLYKDTFSFSCRLTLPSSFWFLGFPSYLKDTLTSNFQFFPWLGLQLQFGGRGLAQRGPIPNTTKITFTHIAHPRFTVIAMCGDWLW